MKQEECQKWVDRDAKVISPCSHLSYFPLTVASAAGDIVTDADGNQFIDFLTSASSLNLGSAPPVVIDAIERQMKKCLQYTAAYTYNQPMIEYAERLVSVYPGKREAKVCFGNCGSDANDAAIKFARAYTGRSKIITFKNAYHGNTYGSSSLSACSTRMRHRLGPFLPDIYHFTFYPDTPETKMQDIDYTKELNDAFATYLPPNEVAADIIEPMQGDGGLYMAHPAFMQELYALCRQHGILFIAEEVQQGFFRTQRWFSIEHYGIIPDGIIMGKSLGAGLTLGAFMAPKDIINCLPAPAHLFTLGGNQLACAAGIASFDYMKSQEFQDILHRNADDMCTLLQELSHQACVAGFHGTGMSFGIDICNPAAGKPDPERAFKLVYRSYELGLLVISVAGHILRIQPPLTISKEHLQQGFAILQQAMNDVENGAVSDTVLQHRRGW